jgi:bifunctional DNA-binding transcriptional regulator/antitoxin component of YhaV-PrlF toxin-antitoxin module
MKTVGIIRDRGQLTIPDSVREIAGWVRTSSVVSISIENPQEIIITPHQVIREMDLDNLRELIKKSRAIKGKGSISAYAFLLKERGTY